MAFSLIPGLDSNDIQVQLPAAGDTDWATNIRDLAFLLLAEHDHTTAKGQPIGTTALTADGVTGAKILLANGESLRAKNGSAVATNIFNYDDDGSGSDKILLEEQLVIENNVMVQGANNGGTNSIDIAKVNTSDKVELGNSNISVLSGDSAGITATNMLDMGYAGSFTMADNQSSAANVTGVLAAAEESLHIIYKITRGSSIVQDGKIDLDENNAQIIEERYSTTGGVTFTNVAGQLKYTSTSTGTAPVFNFLIVRG